MLFSVSCDGLFAMGSVVSDCFQSGSALLSTGNHRGCSEFARSKLRLLFVALTANPKVTAHRLDGVLSQIPKVSLVSLYNVFNLNDLFGIYVPFLTIHLID